MSFQRFEMIDSFLQIKSNISSDTPCIEKIQPLIDCLDLFNQNYIPSNKLCIDELVAPFKGIFKGKVYNKNKPCKWGIRIFGQADSLTGYCLKIIPYFGQETYANSYKNLDELVLHMMKPYANQDVHLYMDNYYTHPTLLLELKDYDIDCTGTFRQQRKDIPKQIKEAVVGSHKSNKKKNIRYFFSKDGLSALKWYDKREVCMLTSYGNLQFVEKFNRKNKVIKKPAVVFDYVQYMGGVDRLNQKIKFIR